MQNLAAGNLYGIGPEFTSDSLIQELVPDVVYKRFSTRWCSSSLLPLANLCPATRLGCSRQCTSARPKQELDL
jgi:hypothetical protein